MDATTTMMPNRTAFAFQSVTARSRVPVPASSRLAVAGLLLIGLATLVVALGIEPAALPGVVAHQFALSVERLQDWGAVMARGLSDPFAFSYPLPAGYAR